MISDTQRNVMEHYAKISHFRTELIVVLSIWLLLSTLSIRNSPLCFYSIRVKEDALKGFQSPITDEATHSSLRLAGPILA